MDPNNSVIKKLWCTWSYPLLSVGFFLLKIINRRQGNSVDPDDMAHYAIRLYTIYQSVNDFE